MKHNFCQSDIQLHHFDYLKAFPCCDFYNISSVLNENEKTTHHLACYRFHRPKFEATLSQAAAVLECCNFLSYRFPSPVGKVLSQMTRGQACSLSPRKSARCFLKLSIPCFVLSSVTEMHALYLSIGFSSPLRYMLMTAFTILYIVLWKSKRTATARSCEVTLDD